MTLNYVFDWSLHNFCAYFSVCDDIGKCPMLKVAIQRAIEKLPHYDLAGNLFNVDHGIYKHQFVGFVSSYTWFNVLMLFHLHSFVTFYTDSDYNTVVTCSLTTRHHILSNMQDCLAQLLQLMQFWRMNPFLWNWQTQLLVLMSRSIKIPFMGTWGWVLTFNEDGSDDVYTFGISMPIRMVQYRDSFT